MLAGEWKGEKVQGLGEWIQCTKNIPSEEYYAVAKTFNPTEWSPDAIAKLAADAGMKYLIITSKHHEGFALFDSKVSEYNIINSAYGQDLLKPLVEACRRHSIMPGFYYSQDLDWHDFGGGLSRKNSRSDTDFAKYLERKVKPQLTELLSNYGDIGVIWFDTPINLTYEQSKDIGDLVHSLQPNCIFNSRLGHGFGDFESLGDNQVPGGACEKFAETAGTINDTWGYKNIDQDWKTPREVILQLCELASKGVNYLLNIGPDGLGRIPVATVDCLQKVGEWTKRCGEAIYEAKANPLSIQFAWGTITTKGNRIFLLVKDLKAKNISLEGVKGYIESAQLLGYPQAEVTAHFDREVLKVYFDATLEPYVPVIELTFTSVPQLQSGLWQLSDGSITLPVHLSKLNIEDTKNEAVDFSELDEDVRIQYESKKKLNGDKRPDPFAMQIEPGGFIENWKSISNSIEWEFELNQIGEFEIWVSSVSSKYVPWYGGHKVRVESGDSFCEAQLIKELEIYSPHSKYYPENSCKIGDLNLNASGKRKLKLSALQINTELPEGLAITEIKLLKKQ